VPVLLLGRNQIRNSLWGETVALYGKGKHDWTKKLEEDKASKLPNSLGARVYVCRLEDAYE